MGDLFDGVEIIYAVFVEPDSKPQVTQCGDNRSDTITILIAVADKQIVGQIYASLKN